MNAPLPHRIRRLRWQARAPTAAEALALRTLLRDGSDELMAALDRGLSALVPDDGLVCLPRLELHLRLGKTMDTATLATRIEAAVAEACATATADPAGTDLASARIPAWAAPVGAAARSDVPGGAAGAVDPITAITLDAWLATHPAALQTAIAAALACLWPAEGEDTRAELRLAGWTTTLPVSLLRRLAEQAGRHALTPLGLAPHPEAGAGPEPSASTGISPGASPVAPAGQPLAPAAGTTALHGQASLATYLLTGSADWQLAGLDPETIQQVLRAAARVWARVGAVPACVVALPLAQRLGALLRWLGLLPEAVQAELIATQPSPVSAALARQPLTAALRHLLDSQASGTTDLQHARALWLAWSTDVSLRCDHPDPFDAPFSDPLASWKAVLPTWLAALLAGRTMAPPWQAVLAQLDPGDETSVVVRHDTPAPDTARAVRAGNAAAPSAPHDAADRVAAPHEPPDEPRPFSDRPELPAPAGLVVPSAGLVLLHPWLARLLDATGHYPAGSKGPIADAALPGAAALLHWLASGREVEHEFELPFVKLLLGHAPDQPLAHQPPALSDALRGEADALLDAALQHWSALRGTSTSGLRTSFLQRRGLIERREQAWLLRVEPESFDLLLGMLPWSISLLRLPWMTLPLHTEWTTP